MDPAKVQAVKGIDPKSINNLEKVRAFLGLCGYYRRFIKDYHIISEPLVALTKAGVDVETEALGTGTHI